MMNRGMNLKSLIQRMLLVFLQQKHVGFLQL